MERLRALHTQLATALVAVRPTSHRLKRLLHSVFTSGNQVHIHILYPS